jgi:tRNA (guanine-N7-)-methyltransferase
MQFDPDLHRDDIKNMQRSQYYGRRSSRRLTGSRIDRLMESLAAYSVTLPEEGTRLTLANPIRLEIGFGSGEHLLELAKRHPGENFIGCEPFLNGVSALVRELKAQDLGNVRVFSEDARLLLSALPDASVSHAYVMFADPWPKLRHNRRRMIGPQTLDQFARILTPAGEIILATDHADLARWYEECVAAHPAFTIMPALDADPLCRPAEWPETRYERKAREAGRVPKYYRVNRA